MKCFIDSSAFIEDKMLSFTDCIIVSIVKKYNIDRVFTFDSDFKKIGFEIVLYE